MSYFTNLSRREFIWGMSCACGTTLILPSCAEVAMSDRKQIKIFSDDYLHSKAFPAYENFKSQAKLITGTSETKKIIDIGLSIRDAINVYYAHRDEQDPTSNFQWEFVLVDNDQIKNAWCMPGGKIAFYTGLMPIAKNDNGIAAIMGHEIAHAVARHSAERMSTAILVDAGTYALERFVLGQRLPSFSKQLRRYGLDLPFNRKQESEADYMGIIFSNLAGYNIDESYKIWERMQKEGGAGPAEFFSTHPSPENRIKKLKEWIPEIRSKYPSIKLS